MTHYIFELLIINKIFHSYLFFSKTRKLCLDCRIISYFCPCQNIPKFCNHLFFRFYIFNQYLNIKNSDIVNVTLIYFLIIEWMARILMEFVGSQKILRQNFLEPCGRVNKLWLTNSANINISQQIEI